MALKFHYNKTTIQEFRRQLTIREKALPILKNKETALRREVKIRLHELDKLKAERTAMEPALEKFRLFWAEFPNILVLEDPGIYQKRIMGVKIPEFAKITFRVGDISWWNYAAWVPGGIKFLRRVITLDLKIDTVSQQVALLDATRKKTTQKVNLYEKVQIPAYEEAILKVKRFLEDRENISIAAQKIVKKRKERRAVA